jgi:hypothetical protein
MNKQIICILLFLYFSTPPHIYAQDSNNSVNLKNISKLFRNQKTLPIKLLYSNKNLKRNTNDSTYIKSTLQYKQKNDEWRSLDVELRARGNFRRENCYFPPIKIKIKKEASKSTLFKGNKKLKLVLPCLLQKDKNDNVIKEYIAYKLYELISPYHFKTRLADITLTEPKGKKLKVNNKTIYRFSKKYFKYNEKEDYYICPYLKKLTYRGLTSNGYKLSGLPRRYAPRNDKAS